MPRRHPHEGRPVISKKALVRIEEGARAISAAEGCAELLDVGLEEQLGPALAVEAKLPNGGGTALRVARRMATLSRSLKASKEVLERLRDELRRWRRRRDRAMSQVYDKAKHLRRGCRHLYGKARADEFLGLRGKLPREPGDLHEQLGPLIGRLADAEWPEPSRKGMRGLSFDREEAVDGLAERYGELGRALDAVDEGETREKMALMVKDRAEKIYETFRGRGTRYLIATLELAGLDELAATLRPGGRRPGRPAKAELAAPPPAAALPAETETGAEEEAAAPLEAEEG